MLSPVMTKSEVELSNEWQEARYTVGRFDGYLADVRKYGFTLVTALLTASALITPPNTEVDRPAAAIVILLLLLALFMIDMYYYVMLQAAVGRATELEGSPERITGVLTAQARASFATEVNLAFYGLFVIVTTLIPIVALVTSGKAPAAGITVMVVALIVEAAAMTMIYILVEHPYGAVSNKFKLTFHMAERSVVRPKV
jgi:hypothetical protein